MNGALAQVSRFHLHRRMVQGTTLLLVILVPALGLFRIDPRAGALVVLDRQIWFADFFLIAGLWIILLSLLVMLYSTAGTVFCGWVCPQNIFSEWANYMTHRLLGKRAEVSLDGQAPVIAPAKNRVWNWVLLGLSFLLASMFLGVIPLFYFYDPSTILAFFSAVGPCAGQFPALDLCGFCFDHSGGYCGDPPLLVPFCLRVPGLAAQFPDP
jgi:Polyferredoxin